MAQTLSTNVEGIHEALFDELALLNNENTIFSSTVQNGGRAEGSVFYRVADKRLTGRLRGRGEASATDRTKIPNHQENRKKIAGVVQQKREAWGTSSRTQKVERVAGVPNVEANNRFRALERHKEGKELIYLSQQVQMDDEKSAWNDDDTLEGMHLTQGASAWIESSAQTNAEFAVNSNYRPPSTHLLDIASVSAFTETNLRTMIANIRKAKREAVNIIAFGTVDFCDHLATFFDSGSTASSVTPIRRFNQSSDDHEITSMLTGYRTANGRLTVSPTELLNGVRNAGAVTSASGTSGDRTITCASTVGLQPYMKLKHANLPAGTYIASITNATTFETSADLTGNISSGTIVVGELDHALFLEMQYFTEYLNGLEEVDLSKDGSGAQGYVEEFMALHCSMPLANGKARTLP
jgi:hypothetical protein